MEVNRGLVLAKIANYFHTSTDYLLETEVFRNKHDLKFIIEHMTVYNGMPITEADRVFLVDFMTMYLDRNSSDESSTSHEL